MFCKYCGTQLRDGANFCSKCGNKINTDSNTVMHNMAPKWSAQEIEQKIRASYEVLKNVPGYYCCECGNYINKQDYAIQCPCCGTEVIGANYLGNTLEHGFLSMMINTAYTKNYGRSTSYIADYYNSEFYRKNQQPYERVACDKGLMGEYQVDRQYQILKKSYPGRRFHILYNLLVPEPNGSFEEIDAVIIYGDCLFVIEAKNRSGSFSIGHLTDTKWQQTLGSKSQEVTSPLMQNEWHIDALENFLTSKGIQDVTFLNYVTLAGGASFDFATEPDAYDNTIVHPWMICNTSRLTEGIVESIQLRDSAYAHNGQPLAEALEKAENKAQQIIAALAPQIGINKYEHDLLMRDREETGSSRRRYSCQYYYAETAECLPTVIRWNREYLQIIMMGPRYYYWGTNDNWHVNANGRPQYQNDATSYCELTSPLQIVKAVECVRTGKDYQEGRQQYYQEVPPAQSTTGSDADILFAGCDTLDKFNARYRSLAHAFHPDEGAGDEESFKKMKAVYERLRENFKNSSQ